MVKRYWYVILNSVLMTYAGFLAGAYLGQGSWVWGLFSLFISLASGTFLSTELRRLKKQKRKNKYTNV